MNNKRRNDSAPPPAAREQQGAPDREAAGQDRNQPIHSIRMRNVRAAIWANRSEKGTFYSVTITRSYRSDDGAWHSTESFGRDDLLLVAKVADLAHTWVTEQIQAQSGDVPL